MVTGGSRRRAPGTHPDRSPPPVRGRGFTPGRGSAGTRSGSTCPAPAGTMAVRTKGRWPGRDSRGRPGPGRRRGRPGSRPGRGGRGQPGRVGLVEGSAGRSVGGRLGGHRWASPGRSRCAVAGADPRRIVTVTAPRASLPTPAFPLRVGAAWTTGRRERAGSDDRPVVGLGGDAGHEVPLAHQEQGADGTDQGHDGGDGHEVVEGRGEPHLVGLTGALAGRPPAGWRPPPGGSLRRPWRRSGRCPPWARTARPQAWPARAATMSGRIWLWKTAPSPAMPVAMPTWRKVLFAPEAMPLRWGCTTETAPEASTGLVIPTPNPADEEPGQQHGPGRVGADVGHEQQPPATKSSPMPSR